MSAPESTSGQPACPHVASCRLYPLFRVQSMLKVWQLTYCDGDHRECQRFQRATRGDAVPDNLLPNGKLLGGK